MAHRATHTLFIVLAVIAATMHHIPARAQTERPRVAVVLSGGGAKGAAHIGVLRTLEEAGVPIDYVVGTSMGAVIGGLYAAGYTPNQLDTLIKSQDWELLLSDKTEKQTQTLSERELDETYMFSFTLSKEKKTDAGGLVKGLNLASLLSKLTIGYHDETDFSTLPTPFACVATDLVNGKEVVFTEGRLAVAIRASMAIPAMFTPVRLNDMVLIDGGMTNNFPVDVARSLGADIVIGATVSSQPPTAEQLSTFSEVLMQTVSIACASKWEQNIADCDVHIDIDTGSYGMLDFKPAIIEELIGVGAATTLQHWDELMDIRRRTIDMSLQARRDTMTAVPPVDTVMISHITYPTDNRHEQRTIARQCRLYENQQVTLPQIEKAVRMLKQDFNYSGVYYSLTDVGSDRYDLTLYANRKDQTRLRVGVRFDTEEMGSVIVRGEGYFNTRLPSSLYVEGRVGKQYMAAVGYRFEPMLNRSLTIGYEFNYHDIDVHSHGSRAYNMTFRQHAAVFKLTNLSVRNMRWELGMRIEHFDFNSVLTDAYTQYEVNLNSDTYIDYYAKITHRTLDDVYFPTRGTSLTASYTLITDDFAHMADDSPVSAVDVSWGGAVSLAERTAFLPAVNLRWLLGGDAPTVYGNMIGGNYRGKYLDRQVAFSGINTMEQTRDVLLTGNFTLRQQIATSHYLSLTADLALNSDKIGDIGSGVLVYGIGAKYAYQTMFGPVEASLGYFNRNNNATMIVSLGYYF